MERLSWILQMGRPHDLPLSDENLFCMWSERYDRNVVLGVESA